MELSAKHGKAFGGQINPDFVEEYVLNEMQAMPFWHHETLLPLHSIPCSSTKKCHTEAWCYTIFTRCSFISVEN